MHFSIEQISKYSNYDEICAKFLSIAPNDATKSILIDILYAGKANEYQLKSKFHCRDNPSIERTRRIAMASLALRNPQTLTFFEQNNVKIFHGVDASALPTILKYGLHSQKSLEENGIPILTGEEWSRQRRDTDFISFTDVLDLAIDYTGSKTRVDNDILSFGVVIGISESELDKARIVNIESDLSEIGVQTILPLESISCICVPDDKVQFVKKMLNNSHITVLGMQDISKKGYNIYENKPIQIIPGLTDKKIEDNKKFSLSEIKEIATSRLLSQMRPTIEKIKNIFVKEDEKIGRNVK